MSKLYDDAPPPWELEPHYSRHVEAMTAEDLRSKADIATQLAWRDQQLSAATARASELERELADANAMIGAQRTDLSAYRLQRAAQLTAEADDRERGLYRKYRVERLSDPMGKHRDCTYFVIDEVHDRYAGAALRAYADACEGEFGELARDLRTRHPAPDGKGETNG